MTTSKRNQSALRATIKREDAAVAERMPEVAAAQIPETAAAPKVDEKPKAKASAAAKPKATVATRATAKPATAKSATAKPATAKPATAKSATAKPATAKPAAAKPATAKSVAAKPPAMKTAAVKTSRVKAAEPSTVLADAAAAVPIAPKLTAVHVIEGTKQKSGKVVRDSFSMPKSEHAELKNMRTALARAGRLTTKSEVLRAAVRLLGERSVKDLVAVLDTLPVVPKGKGKK